MIKAVFFDFDGVLTKDEWEVTTTSRYISEKLGLDLEETCELYKDSADVWKVYSGEITEDQSWKGFYEKLKSANLISMGYNEFKAMRKEAFKSTQLDDKMVDLVKKIKSGGYFVGLITDNCKERIQAISEVYGFDDLFDVFVVSEEEKAIKRQGKPFETALKKVRVDAQETTKTVS